MSWNYILESKHIKPLQDITKSLEHVEYKYGAKAPSLDVVFSSLKAIDCSGFVRLVIYRLIGLIIPDGSWAQEQWCIDQGFKKSTPSDAQLHDNRIRIAFKPGQVRHVVLIANGMTYESCSGPGPSSRPWNPDKYHWQRISTVYVLTDPLKP